MALTSILTNRYGNNTFVAIYKVSFYRAGDGAVCTYEILDLSENCVFLRGSTRQVAVIRRIHEGRLVLLEHQSCAAHSRGIGSILGLAPLRVSGAAVNSQAHHRD